MAEGPIIKRVQLTRYRIPMKNLATDLAFSAGAFYEPGSVSYRRALGIHTSSPT